MVRRLSQSFKDYYKDADGSYGVKELVFLRDIRYGFLPDNHEVEYKRCLAKISTDPRFAVKCLQLALRSRNEDIVKTLLDALKTDKSDFARNNFLFVEPILLEATQAEDLQSIRSILEWRELTAVRVGFSKLEQKLLKMNKESQEVIITAAILDNFEVVKVLYLAGYRIYYESGESAYQFNYRITFPKDNDNGTADFVAHHIDRIRKFKALSSPAYIAMSCKTDPITHCFDFCISANLRIKKEPEFRSEYEEVVEKCKSFAVAILDNCRNSEEVEAVLLSKKQLRRALDESQKEFVAHPYSQLLLYSKWTKGLPWATYGHLKKLMHILTLSLVSPFLCIMYLFSQSRDHSKASGPTKLLIHLDRPINRFILNIVSYCFFLFFLILSVLHGIGDYGNQLKEFLDLSWKADSTWYFNITTLWIICFTLRDIKDAIKYTLKKKRPLGLSLLVYNLIMEVIFGIAIGLKYYGYSEIAKARQRLSRLILMRRIIAPSPSLDIVPALVVGANLYGVGASLAFLKLIFVFEIHHKFGPILFA
ncbi:short transient receptor potential channel 5 [Lepeophtheirus salmonis]|uniref:short transient receptor potential channel 5 n=1 Tax=Lepeophtheirus salmonis TaxID=72036 RepID=UPI001AE6A85C|nr:short transient receptor potential channel 5-like [Lepeophtheirus salmonis]